MSGNSSGGFSGGGAPPEQLRARLEPIVSDAVTAGGYVLDSLDISVVGRKRQVRVVVDHDNGIGLDEVADVSRMVSEALDANEDAVEGSYTLEVTSPGVDRPLTVPRHWRRAAGRQVKCTFTDGAHALVRAGNATEQEVSLLFDSTQVRAVAYTDIDKAVVEVEFGKTPPAELELLGLSKDEEESK